MDKLYTIAEVAEKLNLSDKTLRRWEEAGRFTPSRTLGNQRRYSLEDLQILDAIKHDTIPNQSDLLTVEQAAKFCGVSTLTINRWEDLGKIHPLITSGTTYYPKHKLLEKMTQLKQEYKEEVQKPILEKIPELPTKEVEEQIPEPPKSTQVEVSPPKLTPLSIGEKTPKSLDSLKPYLTQVLITTILILIYHLLMSYATPQSLSPLASPTSGSVQGATTIDPRLDILEKKFQDYVAADMLQKAKPTPITTINLDNSQVFWGTGNLTKAQDQIIITNPKIESSSIVTINFTTDYAPAKKYWTKVSPGSFTVHTDFPVGENTQFNYLLLTPNTASSSAQPK